MEIEIPDGGIVEVTDHSAVTEMLRLTTEQQAEIIQSLRHQNLVLAGEVAEFQSQLEVIRSDRDNRVSEVNQHRQKLDTVHADLKQWQDHHARLEARVRKALGDDVE